jgi:hypothetical protein
MVRHTLLAARSCPSDSQMIEMDCMVWTGSTGEMYSCAGLSEGCEHQMSVRQQRRSGWHAALTSIHYHTPPASQECRMQPLALADLKSLSQMQKCAAGADMPFLTLKADE